MQDKVNLEEALARVDEPFRPKIVATMNDYKLQVGKVRGEFVWHAHADTDDFFLVVNGRLTIQLRDGDAMPRFPRRSARLRLSPSPACSAGRRAARSGDYSA